MAKSVCICHQTLYKYHPLCEIIATEGTTSLKHPHCLCVNCTPREQDVQSQCLPMISIFKRARARCSAKLALVSLYKHTSICPLEHVLWGWWGACTMVPSHPLCSLWLFTMPGTSVHPLSQPITLQHTLSQLACMDVCR